MAPSQPKRWQQSTRSARATSATGTKIQLRDGKQLTLPPWMSFHHLPEYGIASSSGSQQMTTGVVSSSSSALQSIAGEAATQCVENGRSTRLSRRSKRNNSAPAQGSDNANNNTNTYTAPEVSASNYKTKKDIAADSLYPPTSEEIYGHIRYLSKEGMTLVMKEVDDCVGYSLKYSASKRRALARNNDDEMEMKDRKNDLMTLASEIHNYLNKFQPADVEEDGKEEISASLKTEDECRVKIKTEPGAIKREDILLDMVPKKYDPTLLPMVTLKCYPNILDRIEMTQGLLADLSKVNKCNPTSQDSQHNNYNQQQEAAEKGKPQCVCIVRSSSELVQQGHIMTEILSQCISNDPNGEAFALELQRQRKRQKSHNHGGVNRGVLVRSIWSWTQSLVDWAGFTEAFGSVVVIMEDPEKIASPTLDSFFTTLASLRSNHGVPISVIVIDATPGGLGDRLSKLRDPSLRGTMGVMACALFVPPPQIQLDIFVNRLFSGKCIPTFLWTNDGILKYIHELFEECDNSIVSVAKQLKSELRRYFSIPGAFTSLLNCEKFIVPNETRVKWLFGDENSRQIMLSHANTDNPSTKEDQKGSHIFDLFWRTQTSYLCHQLCQRINAIFDVSPLRKAAGSDFHSGSRMRELVQLLSKMRSKVTSWKNINADLTNHSYSLCMKLNEYIILIGRFVADEESSQFMASSLIKNIMSWASEQFSTQITLGDAPTVQPRRDVAKTLSSLPVSDPLTDCSLAHARRIAFQVFQSRVMTLADWHEQYFDIVADQDGQTQGMSSNEAAFFFAVYELVHCGLVKKLTTGRRKEEAYEKVSIAWSSGR